MWRKLKSKTAETLLETIVSMLIAVLSVTLLTTGVMAASTIHTKTNEADRVYKEELEAAEAASGIGTKGSVTITFEPSSGTMLPKNVDVLIYGTGDTYASYQKE